MKRLGSGESTAVPPRLGRFEARLRPILISAKVPRKKVEDVLGLVGIIYVLMESDGSSERGAGTARRDFNGALRRGLNDTVKTATVVEGAVELDEQRLRAFENDVKARLIRAIVKTRTGRRPDQRSERRRPDREQRSTSSPVGSCWPARPSVRARRSPVTGNGGWPLVSKPADRTFWL